MINRANVKGRSLFAVALPLVCLDLSGMGGAALDLRATHSVEGALVEAQPVGAPMEVVGGVTDDAGGYQLNQSIVGSYFVNASAFGCLDESQEVAINSTSDVAVAVVGERMLKGGPRRTRRGTRSTR